ncbi:UNVERIFIED_CONTAM: hypothetical protein FKN15_038470 [Acipenser sinensis]
MFSLKQATLFSMKSFQISDAKANLSVVALKSKRKNKDFSKNSCNSNIIRQQTIYAHVDSQTARN